ncbi:diguanylate cyclase (GGDEF)-like protein/PAS domain S-box-containing protein [Arthrobacter sp. B3I9]|uniref:diguanylate cyclase domain-containing protein n=1 Tax=Arthrobacter sp. B3I9 TaxID=3042270 RepID=UPI00278CE888|nr:diguanylate cyclase [Arthrobacter sp. B3I9]MDQ0851261.1 diguanylate cyclase (GGDEF)-like protein/PAS domain S-box-containing protein [Arthrobacter sp. B3I9]
MESGFAQILLEHGPDALLLLAPDGSISFLNAAAEDFFGYSRSQLLGTDSSLLLAESSRQDFHDVLAGLGSSAGRSGQPFAGFGRRADGTEVPVEITCSALPSRTSPTDDGGTGGTGANAVSQAGPAVALSVRGTAHPRWTPAAPAPAAAPAAPAAFANREDQLRARVLRDELTALPNGNLFNERLAAALRRPDPVDVLLLNMDDLKSSNDIPGRLTDELLVVVASRLWNCVRPHDTVARLGGNEFVVLLTECLNADAAARRIAESVSAPMRVGRSVVRPGVSMGLASRTPQTQDGAELLRQAGAALTAARATGQHTWLRFRPEMLS